MATFPTFFDMVYVYATETSGHGPFTLGNAVTGFQTAAEAGITNGAPVSYKATDGVNWETAHGVVDVSGSTYTLTRGVDTIRSSNSNSLVDFGSGVVVSLSQLSQDLNTMLSAGAAQSFTAAQQAQGRANLGLSILALDVYLNSAQTPSQNAFTVVSLNQVVTDAQSAFDTSTYKYTPNIAGLYLFIGCIDISGTASASNNIISSIYKNGSATAYNAQLPPSNTNVSLLQVMALVQMNGTTDYVQLVGYTTYASPQFNVGAASTRLQAVRL